MVRACSAGLSVLLMLAVLPSRAAECDPGNPALPPIARKAPSAQARAAALKLIDPARLKKLWDSAKNTDDINRDQLGLFLEAIRVDPSLVEARLGLAALIAGNYDTMASDCGGAAGRVRLLTWLVRTLEELRDAAWDTGCAACVAALSDLRHYEFLETSPEVETAAQALFLSLAQGPPGRLGDASRAILAALGAQWDSEDDVRAAAWAKAAPFLDGGTIRVVEGFNGSGADEPRATSHERRVRGPAGLRDWLGKISDFPGAGATMWCAGSCCEMPFIDDHPHKHQMTRLCFDKGLHLRLLATDSSGM